MNIEPVLKCFLTAVLPGYSRQLSPCADFEMRMVDCMEAYGLRRGEKECADYIADLHECVYQGKQRLRIELMRQERLRQYEAGEIPHRYEKAPEHDAY